LIQLLNSNGIDANTLRPFLVDWTEASRMIDSWKMMRRVVLQHVDKESASRSAGTRLWFLRSMGWYHSASLLSGDKRSAIARMISSGTSIKPVLRERLDGDGGTRLSGDMMRDVGNVMFDVWRRKERWKQ
jgi:hypothetical protein